VTLNTRLITTPQQGIELEIIYEMKFEVKFNTNVKIYPKIKSGEQWWQCQYNFDYLTISIILTIVNR